MWRVIGFLLLLTVVGFTAQGTLPEQTASEVLTDQQAAVFKVLDAPAGELDIDTSGATVTVQVSYPALAAGDTVGLRLSGVVLRDMPIQKVSTVGVLTFDVPSAWFVENLNHTVTLTHTHKVVGVGSLITSSPLSVRVVGTPGQAVFKVVEAPAGELNVDTLGATATATVQVSYPTLTVGDTVGLRLSGVVLRDTPIRKVSTVGVLTFDVPNAWLVENLNHTVTLTHTHKEGGTGSLITSAPILIKVVGVLSDGQRVANRLNEQYATTSNTCPGNKAAFYCSGVLIRVTDASTAFHAWNPSPSSVALGSVAFSYMKVDLSMNRLAFGKLQGLILKPAEVFTQNGDYPLKVLCAYAYDANSVSRSLNGCGENIDFPTDSGTCASLKITTLAAWRAHFQKYPITSYLRFHHQCSLGTDQASFELSLTAREDPAAELVAYAHNEIIIKTWPQDTKNLPIEAFFYWYTGTETSGLAAAKYMQQDFYQMTAKKVPIIRVIPDTSAAQIFSYHAAEQGL